MDRFIGISENDFLFWYDNLKSNMDRFIVIIKITLSVVDNHLKSNMDRFIANFSSLVSL